MAVKLSINELTDPGLVARVRDTLLDAGLEPSALRLECAERAVTSYPEGAQRTPHAGRRGDGPAPGSPAPPGRPGPG